MKHKFSCLHALFLSFYPRNLLLLTTRAMILGKMNFSSGKFSQTTMRMFCSLRTSTVKSTVVSNFRSLNYDNLMPFSFFKFLYGLQPYRKISNSTFSLIESRSNTLQTVLNYNGSQYHQRDIILYLIYLSLKLNQNCSVLYDVEYHVMVYTFQSLLCIIYSLNILCKSMLENIGCKKFFSSTQLKPKHGVSPAVLSKVWPDFASKAYDQ